MQPTRRWRNSFNSVLRSCSLSRRQSIWLGIFPQGSQTIEPLRHPEVVPLVLVRMAADQPLESNFFPGLLEGLLGRLGIAAPGESNPPRSSPEGAGRLWSSAVREAISQIEQREVETLGTAGLPQCLDLCYEEDFLKK